MPGPGNVAAGIPNVGNVSVGGNSSGLPSRAVVVSQGDGAGVSGGAGA